MPARMPARLLEVEIARPVVALLGEWGETFPEVAAYSQGPRADIVLRRHDGLLDVCEVKRAPGWKLVAQVEHWKGYAHRVWAAYVPPRGGAIAERWGEELRN